mgnify:FL=1
MTEKNNQEVEEILSDEVIKSYHKKRKNLSARKKDRFQEGMKIWTCFYRLNIHRFATDYLQLNLYPFQMIILYLMNIMYSSCFICARGLSKSYTTAVFACCRAVLFPGQLILISCTTKEQSRNLVREKIGKELMKQSPMLRREIADIKVGTNETCVYFRNGSTIQAINASENTRGLRCHILVIDEYRMIQGGFDTLNSILKPFLNCVRIPKFKNNENSKYKNYPSEENKTIYLSSAWLGDHWSYDLYKEHREKMLKGEDWFTCNLPYQLSAHHGLLTKKRIDDIVSSENMSDMSFSMEFEALWYKTNDHSFFKPSDILPLRTLEYAWYPPTTEEYATQKNKDMSKKSYYLKPIVKDEMRVISCDIALMDSKNGKNNDNAIFTFFRCLPKNENYIAEVLYQASYEGAKAKELALYIKRLYYDAQCEYIVLDVQGNGLSVLDELGEPTVDVERGETYPPLKAMNEDRYADRCGYANAQKCIFCIAGNQKLNHEIATQLKTSFQNKTIRMLKNQMEAEDIIEGYATMSPQEQANKLLPYIQTSLMQNEIICLEYEIKQSYIRVYETGKNRKDRYSSLSYGNYFIRLQEKKLKKKKKGSSINLW